MSILKLAPACKDYLWGGTKLITDYGKRYDGARLAETWELSGHPDGPSVLASGPDAGKTLAEYLAAHPGALGEHGRKFAELPVLIKLIDAAKQEGASYALDVYPHYGSDVEATLGAGSDIRHGLIGPGVYASHGYERSHVDGVENTLRVLKGYLGV